MAVASKLSRARSPGRDDQADDQSVGQREPVEQTQCTQNQQRGQSDIPDPKRDGAYRERRAALAGAACVHDLVGGAAVNRIVRGQSRRLNDVRHRRPHLNDLDRFANPQQNRADQ